MCFFNRAQGHPIECSSLPLANVVPWSEPGTFHGTEDDE